LAEIIARDSRQTPVAKIPRLRRTEGEIPLTAQLEHQNHRRASTSRLNTPMLQRMTTKITCFMHRAG
jgi:hypothetical protein